MVNNRSSGNSRRQRVTAADVARLSGVSRATVSYVLNNVPGQTIPEATQAKVRAAAVELSYVPSAAAASLRRGHSRIVIVVTDPALSGFVTEPFLGAIASRLTEAGLVSVSHQYSTDDALHALVDEVRPYGLIALTSLSGEVMSEIEASGVPRVYSSTHGDPSFPRPWEEEIGALQAQHLLDRGSRVLIYAAPSMDNPRLVMAHSREAGVAAACARKGYAPPLRVELGNEPESALHVLRDALPADEKTGICAFDDEVAAVALASLARLELAVPRDVSVIGVDNTPFSPFLTPALTSISIDGRRTGRSLAERFLAGSDGHDAGLDQSSPAFATLIERQST